MDTSIGTLRLGAVEIVPPHGRRAPVGPASTRGGRGADLVGTAHRDVVVPLSTDLRRATTLQSDPRTPLDERARCRPPCYLRHTRQYASPAPSVVAGAAATADGDRVTAPPAAPSLDGANLCPGPFLCSAWLLRARAALAQASERGPALPAVNRSLLSFVSLPSVRATGLRPI
eukprot:gene30870-35914_t